MEIKISFVKKGVTRTVSAVAGETVLSLAHRNGIQLEGACEGSLACSTCHVIVEPSYYEKCGQISESEQNMLDLARHISATSRLGCQIVLDAELNGMVLTIP